MSTYCTKRFADIPFAHRQHNHAGHCQFIHGHNWTFEVEFAAQSRDPVNPDFILDFGGSTMKLLKAWLDSAFDHSMILAEDDPSLAYLQDFLAECSSTIYAQIVVLPSASCEGIAEYALKELSSMVRHDTDNRVDVTQVRLYEDSKNSALCLNHILFAPLDSKR